MQTDQDQTQDLFNTPDRLKEDDDGNNITGIIAACSVGVIAVLAGVGFWSSKKKKA